MPLHLLALAHLGQRRRIRGPVPARWLGPSLEADLDVAVRADLTVEERHAIAHELHHALVRGVNHLDRVTVHANPAGIVGAHRPLTAGTEGH